MAKEELKVISLKNQRAWESWVSAHLASTGTWLKLAKQSARTKSLTYQEALEVALCFGWIDGQKKSFDEHYWLQKFGPRGSRSIWSKINRSKAERLIREGRMEPSGFAAVESAKRSGQWDRAYDSQKTAEPPRDFLKVLNKNGRAKAFFGSLDSQNRYAVLFRIHNAKKAETRAKRIEKFVAMLERHEKLH